MFVKVGLILLQLISIKWRVFIPVFLLFFNYVFSVAVDLLGEAQLFIRLFVVLFCVSYVFLFDFKTSVGAIFIYLFIFLYLLLLFIFNLNPITLNFIYLSIIVFYFHIIRTSQDELLIGSLLASLAVVFLYLMYFFIGSIDFGESNIGGRIRYSFGFSNPNKVGVVSYSLVVLTALCYFRRNISLISGALIIVPFFIVMIYSGSRTAIYSAVIFFLFAAVPFSIYLRKILFIFPLGFLVLSLYIATLHNNEVINHLLSFRPTDFHNYLSTLNSVNYFFGANTAGFRIDNSYMLALFSIGSVGFILSSYFLYRLGRGGLDVYEHAFIVSILVYGVFEGLLVRVEFPLVLYFYYLIVAHNKSYFYGSSRRTCGRVSIRQSSV